MAGRGYEAYAATGRPAAHDYLRGLGAAGFVDRADLAEASKRPLESERWAGGVDSVGSTTLATILLAVSHPEPDPELIDELVLLVDGAFAVAASRGDPSAARHARRAAARLIGPHHEH